MRVLRLQIKLNLLWSPSQNPGSVCTVGGFSAGKHNCPHSGLSLSSCEPHFIA